MAIGTVKLSGTPQQYSQPRVDPNAFGKGVGVALRNLSSTFQGIEDEAERRQSNSAAFDADARWARTQGEWQRQQLDAINGADETGAGLTNGRYDQLEAQRQEFLGSLSPELREKYEGTTETAVQNLTTNAYQSEFTLRNNYENGQIGDMVGEMSAQVIAGTASVDGAMSTVQGLINNSSLSEAERSALAQAADADIRSAAFHKLLTDAQTSNAPAGDWQDKEVVAPGLSPQQRGILNVIAKEESAGSYTVRWSGPGATPQHFSDFSDHPRIFVDNGHGDVSSAAGRYQFTASTWDSLPAYLREGGFTPINQDRAALYLAEKRFNQQLGAGEMTFQQIVNGGTDAQLLSIKSALSPTWAAFNTMSDDMFLNTFKGSQGVRGGGTGSPQVPDVWSDPEYAGLPFEVRAQMAESASAAASNILAQEQGARETNADMLRAALAAGTPQARQQIEQEIKDGNVPSDQVASLLNLTADDREAEASGLQFGQDAVNGVRMANDKDTQDAAMRYFRDSGVAEGVRNQDPASGDMLARTFAATGVMPPEMSQLLEGMAYSSDPRVMQYGMDVMSNMQAKGPHEFAVAMSEDMVQTTTAWNLAAKYNESGNAAAVYTAFDAFRSPEQRQLRETYTEEAKELLGEISNDEYLSEFRTFFDRIGLRVSADNRSGLTPGELVMPASPQAAAQFRVDADALFTQYYPLYQDKDKTVEAVGQMMGYSWGADASGGQLELMYLAPSSPAAGYTPINGDFSWIREDVLQSMGWASDQNFSMMPSPMSDGEVARGEPVSYTLTNRLENGTMQVVMNDEGTAPKVIRPTVTPELQATLDTQQDLAVLRAQKEVAFDNYRVFESYIERAESRGIENDPQLEAARTGLADAKRRGVELTQSIEALEPREIGSTEATAMQERIEWLTWAGPTYPNQAEEIADLERQLRLLGIEE